MKNQKGHPPVISIVIFLYSEEQLLLHSKAYNWPEHMDKIFNQNSVRLTLKRDQAEEQLIADRHAFEGVLAKTITALDVYKTKDSPFLNTEEMRMNADALQKLNNEIQAAITESEVN